MAQNVNSFGEAIRAIVRDAFEKRMNEEVDKLETEMQMRLDNRIKEARSEVKKMANASAVELLQKVSGPGYSLEIKI